MTSLAIDAQLPPNRSPEMFNTLCMGDLRF